jgi:putative transposase
MFHVTNRGVERRRLFFKDVDYQAFLRLFAIARKRFAVKVFAICITPNHFHVIIQSESEGVLSAYLHWVQGCYACDLRSHTRTSGNGHVFQQRFWSDVIADQYHFVNVLRYVERNPKESSLVERAESWRWSSLALRGSEESWLDPLPLPLPSTNWLEIVNQEPEHDESF